MREENRFAAEDRKDFDPAARLIIAAIVITVAFAVLLIELYSLQMNEGDAYAKEAGSTMTRTVSVEGERGDILDANGVVLATNEECYEVCFTWDPDKRSTEANAAYSESLLLAIRIIEEDGGKIVDAFRITKNDSGEYVYTWDGDLDAAESRARAKTWASDMSLTWNDTDTPETFYKRLRTRYGIADQVSDEDAFKLLSIWQEAQMTSYSSYIAKTISSDVTISAVSKLELNSDKLDGITVVQSSKRIYPKDEMAAHVIGYTGSIGESVLDDYLENGYSRDDVIGVAGVEQSMEQYLTGSSEERRGSETVEINNMSKVVREVAYEEPRDGDTVTLTLDSAMQKIAYDALGDTIAEINANEKRRVASSPAKYNALVAARGGVEIRYAESGAAVVMDVNSGKLFALVDYPSYNINLFTGGISEEDYAALLADTRSPLFSLSMSSKAAPGSIFKPMTATAALMEGAITLDTVIVDVGTYTLHGIPRSNAIHCWYRAGHGSQTVVTAIQNSCNYFFYETAYRLGNEALTKWADTFGLSSKTGVEVAGEIEGQIASQNTYYDPEKGLYDQKTSLCLYIASVIRSYIREVGATISVSFTDEELNAGIEKIFSAYVSGEDAYAATYDALVDTVGIPAAIVTGNSMSSTIVPMLGELKFGLVDEMITGIGQSTTAVTPIAVARYISALVNGGNVYKATVIEKVTDQDGNVVFENEPEIINTTGVSDEIRNAVKQGMRQAILYGSVSSRFYRYKYRTDIAGKTGTAQTSDIDIENNSWFVCFAPFDEPEIAVVIYIPYGYGSSYAVDAAKQIVQYYLDSKIENSASGLAGAGSVVE